MKLDRNTVFVLVAAVAFGYWLADERSPGPQPPPRPVLTWLARAAKNLLWIAAFADPPPAERNEARFVHANVIGDDGYPLIDHARGF